MQAYQTHAKKMNDIVLFSHSLNWDSRSVGNHIQTSTTQLQISTTADRTVGGKPTNHIQWLATTGELLGHPHYYPTQLPNEDQKYTVLNVLNE